MHRAAGWGERAVGAHRPHAGRRTSTQPAGGSSVVGGGLQGMTPGNLNQTSCLICCTIVYSFETNSCGDHLRVCSPRKVAYTRCWATHSHPSLALSLLGETAGLCEGCGGDRAEARTEPADAGVPHAAVGLTGGAVADGHVRSPFGIWQESKPNCCAHHRSLRATSPLAPVRWDGSKSARVGVPPPRRPLSV